MRWGVVQPFANSSPAVPTAISVPIRAERSWASTRSWNSGAD
jgi:hypothetical protein